MKSVIIVDDEIHIRSLLRHLIHWEELGLVLRGSFDGGDEALEFLEREEIDIVISDIMMPGMGGIELIEASRSCQKEIRFILISGHRDFEFARTAVKLGVSDYILKPLNETELNETLDAIVSDINKAGKKTDRHREKFVEVLQGKTTRFEIDRVNSRYGMQFVDGAGYRVLQLGICNSHEEDDVEKVADDVLNFLSRRIRPLCFEIERFQISRLRYDIVIQIKNGSGTELLRTLDTGYREQVKKYKDIMTTRFYLGVGKEVVSLEQLKDSAESAAFFLSGRLHYGNSRIYVADILPQAEQLQKESRPIPKEIIRRFEGLVEAVDIDGMKRVILELFTAYERQERPNPMLCFYMVYELGEHLTLVLNRLNIHPRETMSIVKRLEELSENCDTVSMLRSETEKYCESIVMKYLADKKDNSNTYINMTKQYIEKHYDKQITLNTIAEEIHVNPSYLSTIFKEGTGENYSSYLTGVRIEKAKELLQKLDYNISQIANSVGYTSTRYFSKMFEQETGMKPSEYRRIYLRGLRQ